MTNEIQEIPIETTFKQIRSMRIPDKLAVEEFTKNALKIVRMALVENDFYTAIDTMDKTRVIEDYVKAKVRRNHAQLVTQNIAAAGRYEILWELGGWLDENLVDSSLTKRRPGHAGDLNPQMKPKFWLDDLGISGDQSKHWQKIYNNLTIDELRSGVDQYLHDGASGKEDELTWGKVWTLANPRPPAEPEPALEVDLSSGGKITYRILRKTVKKVITKYFEYINKTSVQTREYMFMSAFFMELAQGLSNAAATLNKTIKEK